MMCQYWDNLNLLSSILTILLTYPNSDTLLCYSDNQFFTVYTVVLHFRINLLSSLLTILLTYPNSDTLM